MSGPGGVPIALTIAGSDSGGGAGLQADLKTFSAFRVYGASIVTAVTAQNTHGVTGVHPVPPDFVQRQIDAVFDDLRIDALKCGMLGDAAVIRAVAQAVGRRVPPLWIIDPVMIAKGGHPLLSPEAVDVLRDELLPFAALITPNLPEAAALLRLPPAGDQAGMIDHGRRLLACGAGAVLVKGGHLDDAERSPDVLVTPTGVFTFPSARHRTKNTHGTGCTLSAALTALAAREHRAGRAVDWAALVPRAKAWLFEALAAADTLHIGTGIGPVHHFHALWAKETP